MGRGKMKALFRCEIQLQIYGCVSASMAAEKERQVALARSRVAARRGRGRGRGRGQGRDKGGVAEEADPQAIQRCMQEQEAAAQEADAQVTWKLQTQGTYSFHYLSLVLPLFALVAPRPSTDHQCKMLFCK
jgi:hypothetical protein